MIIISTILTLIIHTAIIIAGIIPGIAIIPGTVFTTPTMEVPTVIPDQSLLKIQENILFPAEPLHLTRAAIATVTTLTAR
jgi:hypothetical protein